MIVAANPIDLDALRLRHEFLEAPGLDVSVPQVARMLGLRPEHAAAILDSLASESFLTQTPTGSYRRARGSNLIEH
jgi:DNA-binding IclR family transcriptional regulator